MDHYRIVREGQALGNLGDSLVADGYYIYVGLGQLLGTVGGGCRRERGDAHAAHGVAGEYLPQLSPAARGEHDGVRLGDIAAADDNDADGLAVWQQGAQVAAPFAVETHHILQGERQFAARKNDLPRHLQPHDEQRQSRKAAVYGIV